LAHDWAVLLLLAATGLAAGSLIWNLRQESGP
jgi:hypothetical protein